MQKPRKPKIEYRKSRDGYKWYVLDGDKKLVMRVCDWYDNLELAYDTPLSVHDTIPILKSEFIRAVKAIQKKHGVKFSIKTEWGTNENN